MAIEAFDIIKATCRLRVASLDDVINIFTFKMQSVPPTEADALTDIFEYLENIYTAVNSIIPNTVSYADITLFNVTQDIQIGIYPWPNLTTGASASAAVNNVLSMFMFARTGVKRAIGKKWMPLPNSGSGTGNTLNGTALTALTNAAAAWWDSFVGTVGSTNIYPGMLYNHTVPVISSGFAKFTNAVAQALIGVQRRRKRGLGN